MVSVHITGLVGSAPMAAPSHAEKCSRMALNLKDEQSGCGIRAGTSPDRPEPSSTEVASGL